MKKTGRQLRTFVALALLAGLCASCEVERDMTLTHLDSESRIVVYCMPSTARDTTIIKITHSLPLNGDYGSWRDALAELDGCHVTYEVNGVPQTVHETSPLQAAVGTVLPGCYYVVCPHRAGDRITLRVSHEGYPSVRAETTIPDTVGIAQPRVRRISRLDEDGNRVEYYQLSAQFCDNPATANYYAVQVHQLHVSRYYSYDYDDELVCDSTYERVRVSPLDEPLLNPLTDADDEFLYENNFLDEFYPFDDRRLPAVRQPYTLHLDVSAWQVSGAVRLLLYHLSPEYYRFVKSVNDASNNGMAEYGLSTIAPTYSNVVGGLGFVGGYSVTTTPWTDCEPDRDHTLYY